MAFKNFVSSGITVETLHSILLNVGGFYMALGSIPVYLFWVKYLSLFFYGFVLLVSYVWQNVGPIACDTTATKCLQDGPDVLTSLAVATFNEGSVIYFPCFIALIAAFFIIGYLLLKKRLREYAD